MPQDDLQPVEKGQLIHAATTNALIARARAMAMGLGQEGIWDGEKFIAQPVAMAGVQFVPFRVTDESHDFIEGVLWDETSQSVSGPEVKIAKPYLLRKSLFHGLTINLLTYAWTDVNARTVTDANGSENQLIVPEYTLSDPPDYLGDLIWARALSPGITVDNGGTPLLVYWLDTNNDGRKWGEVQ